MCEHGIESGTFRIVRATRRGHGVGGPIPEPSQPTPEGFLLLFTEDWHLVEPANRFSFDVRYKPLKTGRWQNSQRATAHDLAQWWTFLAANGLEWDRAEPEDLSDYGNLMAESVSPVTSLQYSTSTVRRRVGSVETFNSWAKRNGLVAVAPRQELISDDRPLIPIGPNAAFLPHLGTATVARSGTRKPRGRDPEKDPRPFKIEELKRVMARLGPAIFAPDQSLLLWEAGTRARRNRLMAEVAFHTGMRADEVASISAWEVLDRARKLRPGLKWQQFTLTVRTKGRATRTVVISSVLLRALVLYHDLERAAAILRAQEAAEKAHEKFRVPAELFVNGVDANLRDVSRPIGTETASRAFTRAVLAEGLIVYRDGFALDPETGEKLLDEDGAAISLKVSGAAHTFHDLRHTFAVMFYKSELLRGNREPWEKLRELLGHETSETTRNIYLKHVDVDEASISDAAAHHMRMELHAVR